MGTTTKSFRANQLDDINGTSLLADSEVWMRVIVKADGEEYSEWIDYLILITSLLLDDAVVLTPMNKIVSPDFDLGTKLEKKSLNGKKYLNNGKHWICKGFPQNII